MRFAPWWCLFVEPGQEKKSEIIRLTGEKILWNKIFQAVNQALKLGDTFNGQNYTGHE